MALPLESVLSRLDQLQDAARAIASLLVSADSFETSWEIANRVCDHYRLPQFDARACASESRSPSAAWEQARALPYDHWGL